MSKVLERTVQVDGLATRYLAAGSGAPLLLLHGLAEDGSDWRAIMPALGRHRRVYAPDLPGLAGGVDPLGDYSSTALARLVARFLDAVDVRRAAVVGNSLGGLVALRLALSEPARVSALGLVAPVGLGPEVSPFLRAAALPGVGEGWTLWGTTPLGARQRAWSRALLLFHDPRRVPPAWLRTQTRLARRPGFLEASLAALRAHVDLRGQKEVLAEQLGRLDAPTLVLWGQHDRVLPVTQGQQAVARLGDGALALIPACGHLPQVERPEQVAQRLADFLLDRDHA
ncbi:MAG TPA: alpha/beta fold hydrolase [Egibacteraceae bacterium]|nr:alpha/beta fold hydrolase [Egibacteraceae bacterium]